MRAHIVLDEDLVEAIDAIAGKRKRSQFIEEAIRDKLALARQRKAIEEYAKGPGLDPGKYPHWATPERTSKWVHDMREADQDEMDARNAERQRVRDQFEAKRD